MESVKSLFRSLGTATAASLRLLSLIFAVTLLAVAGTVLVGGLNSDGTDTPSAEAGEARVYPENPTPVVFTPTSQLNIAESTIAPGLTDVERRHRLLRSVVYVETSRGSGSGVLIDNQRCIVVTNEHVIATGTGDIKAHVITRFRANGENVVRTVDAEILGRPSADDDLAILRLSECNNLPWAPLGNSDLLESGDTVTAVGHPHGFGWSMTEGVVSHSARFWDDMSAKSGFPLVQIDAPLNPGNSGGGLFNEEGYLVGINSMKRLYAENLNFARSSNLVTAYMGRLAAEGRVYDRTLGIIVNNNDDGSITVQEVATDGRGNHVGLREGDTFIAVNGQRIDGAPSMTRGIYADTDGIVELTVVRNGAVYTLTLDYNQERRS